MDDPTELEAAIYKYIASTQTGQSAVYLGS
jgi:hypothetical protein